MWQQNLLLISSVGRLCICDKPITYQVLANPRFLSFESEFVSATWWEYCQLLSLISPFPCAQASTLLKYFFANVLCSLPQTRYLKRCPTQKKQIFFKKNSVFLNCSWNENSRYVGTMQPCGKRRLDCPFTTYPTGTTVPALDSWMGLGPKPPQY